MVNPLDLNRLALRIEGLAQTSTYGWSPADEWDMRRLLLFFLLGSVDK